MRPQLSDLDFSKKIILTSCAFAVSGVITAGAARANDNELPNGANGVADRSVAMPNRTAAMPGRAIAMSNLPGFSGASVNATIDSVTVGDTVAGEESEPDAEDIADKAKNFVSPDKRAAARKFFSQSMALKKQGDSGGALIGFLKATREDPTLLDAYYEQALIFREKGFHKLAASRLEQALAIKPKFQKARLLLATVKLEQGNVPDAVQQLGKTLGLDEGDRKAKEKLTAVKEEEPLPPPMILQALHPIMPVPSFAEPQKAVEAPPASSPEEPSKSSAASENLKSIDLTTFDLKPAASTKNGVLDPTSDQDLKQQKTAAKPKKVRKGTRQRIRELIARKRRKYGRYSKQKNSKRWIAKIFSVPEPLRFLSKQGSAEKMAAENELQPRAVASNSADARGKNNSKSAYKEQPASKELLPSKASHKELMSNGLAHKETDSKDPAHKEMTSKELERKFETAVAQAFAGEQNNPATAEAHPKSRWPDWHRPLTPKESKEQKANEEFERARKTASAYKASDAPYEPELWKRKSMETRSNPSEADTFKLPNHGSPKSGWLGITSLASNDASSVIGESAAGDSTMATPPVEAPDEDEWTKRLRDLNENGTGTLKKGEAFMFSEDTGEAVLFLADGQKIRRIIASPVSSDELLKLRRPDVMVPKELYYDTSLLGKVVPPIPAPPPPAAASPSSIKQPPPFKMEDLMDGSNGFFGWLKGLVHL